MTAASYFRSPLKWVGGKYRALEHLLAHLPRLDGARFIEPFVGSGTVFLNAPYERFLLSDSNPHLINFFNHVQLQGQAFVDAARDLFTYEKNNEKVYYERRDEFNETTCLQRKALLFLYLNRHGFNGLYRVNQKGIFNVPFGRYKKPYFPEKELYNLHKQSAKAVFSHQDFACAMNEARAGDVVYCDPPYVPLTPTANFSGYTAEGFGAKEQMLLANKAKELAARGVHVLISNHDTPFSQDLYKGARIYTFDVSRTISSDAKTRGKAGELLACFWAKS